MQNCICYSHTPCIAKVIPLKSIVSFFLSFFTLRDFSASKMQLRAKRISNFSCWALISQWCLSHKVGHTVVSLHLAGYPLHQRHRCHRGQCLGDCKRDLGLFPHPSRFCRYYKQSFKKLRGLRCFFFLPIVFLKSCLIFSVSPKQALKSTVPQIILKCS